MLSILLRCLLRCLNIRLLWLEPLTQKLIVGCCSHGCLLLLLTCVRSRGHRRLLLACVGSIGHRRRLLLLLTRRSTSSSSIVKIVVLVWACQVGDRP